MLFKRPIQRYGTTPEPVTPYQKAAQLWDERIGSARVQARNWQLSVDIARAALAAMPDTDPRPTHGNTALLIARASAMYADIGTLLANLDYLMEATGESLDPEDMVNIQKIRAALQQEGGQTGG